MKKPFIYFIIAGFCTLILVLPGCGSSSSESSSLQSGTVQSSTSVSTPLRLQIILEAQGNVSQDKIGQAEQIIRNRIDKLGISESVVNSRGSNQIMVVLAGVENVDEASALIGKTGLLEFKRVDQDLTQRVVANTITPDMLPADKQLLAQTQRDDKGEVVRDANGQPVLVLEVVDRQSLLTVTKLDGASIGYDENNQPKIDLSLNKVDSTKFADVTDQLASQGAVTGQEQQLAIVLDDEVLSAPTVKDKIMGGRAEITGMSLQEVKYTVLVLQTGALPIELSTVDKVRLSEP